MDAISAIAQEYDLAIIEDACEAVGAEYKGRKAGALGDVGVFAFYPNKQMTTGEGGMIVTDREDWDALFRSLRNQGRDVHDAWLNHTRLGYNYRLDEMSAALALRRHLARNARRLAEKNYTWERSVAMLEEVYRLAREQGSGGAGEQGSGGAGERRSRGAEEQGSRGAEEQGSGGAGERRSGGAGERGSRGAEEQGSGGAGERRSRGAEEQR